MMIMYFGLLDVVTNVEAERKSCQVGVCSDVIMKRSGTILKLQLLKQIGG